MLRFVAASFRANANYLIIYLHVHRYTCSYVDDYRGTVGTETYNTIYAIICYSACKAIISVRFRSVMSIVEISILRFQHEIVELCTVIFIVLHLHHFQYATFMILIVIVQLTLGGLAAIYKNDAKIETGNFLRSTISKYYNDAGTVKPDAVNLVWNQLMTDMRCCGVDSYKDFAAAEKWQATKGASDIVMPRECCQRLPASANGTVALVDEECPIRPTSENSYHTTVSEGIYCEYRPKTEQHRILFRVATTSCSAGCCTTATW